MAADYEHGRTSMPLIVTLLFMLWCGITHTGLVNHRVYARGDQCEQRSYNSLAQKPAGLNKQKRNIGCPTPLQNVSKY